MKNHTNASDRADCASSGAKQQLEWALRLLSGKWKSEILYHLVDGKMRFGQLRRAIPDVTQHMLTMQLRDLETEGLVKRTVFAEIPPRVEYEMTPAAKALEPVFVELLRWSQKYGAPVDQKRSVQSQGQESQGQDGGPRISGDDRLP